MRDSRHRPFASLVIEIVCFSLLLQTTGIAAAPQLFATEGAATRSEPDTPNGPRATPSSGSISRFVGDAWSAVGESAASLATAFGFEEPPQVAQAWSAAPLPARLMALWVPVTASAQGGPPSPPGLGKSDRDEVAPPAEIESLLGKAATDEIPLLPGYNLISIPEEPADTSPASVFAPIGGEFRRVEAYDACDLADPWKLYDPANPAASDLTAVDHRIGLWVDATAATALPSDGTLPATTTMNLCVGWNLIGFPAGQARHPLAALASIAGKWQRVFGYDAFDSQDPWEIFDPAVPDWANDLRLMHPGRGYWVLVTEATTLEIRNQGPPPTVAITTPADLAVVTEPTEIVGTIASDRLEGWTLSYRAIGEGEAVTLATGNAPVTDSAFATFDPTLLLNGLYELELTATDVQGQQVMESIAVSVEGQMKIGHFTLSFLDLAIPVSGLDIEIIRTYDSRDKVKRDFGVGWSLDIRQGSVKHNRKPGEGWQLQTGPLPCGSVVETRSHLTVVRLSDQEVYRFALRLQNGVPSTSGGCFADVDFAYIDGPLPGTTLEILGQTQVFWANGSDELLDVDTLAVYEARQVRLTTRDGRIFDLNLADGVTRLEDLNGNQLSITPAGITHSSGKGIVFERDAEGRIERITDPLGRVMSYAYDAAGDLVSFTDRAGATSRFTYLDHLLLDIEDPRGVKPIRNEYDAEGRVIRHIDAFGKVFELGHDLGPRREVVTNRLGASRVLEYDSRGNVVRETDQLGKVTTRTFDGRDNLLAETDPLGRKTTYTYTPENDLETLENPLGKITSYTYDSRGQLRTVTDPRGGVTTNVYDGNNLVSTTDALGKVTTFMYDSSGDLRTTTDALGKVTTFGYDDFGNLIRETDALGNVTDSSYDAAGNRLTETRTRSLPDGSSETLLTTFTYDDLDRLRSTAAADGSSTSTVYDLLGKVLHQTDALGRTTTMTYDLMGRLVSTSYPDGSSGSQSYDAEGRLLAQIDRAGRSTTFTYDAAGRLKQTTYPDGSTTSSIYDDAGQLLTSTDARGNTTTFTYDDAGRRLAVIDPFGNGPTFTYDDNGNQASVTDARGFATSFTYDDLNRLTITTHPDLTTRVVTYDDFGRRVGETDQAGLTTAFGYDALGRLTTVTDALSQVTSYTYDEVGNRLTQTDANGHSTRFEYDRLGRQTARILPDGARESMTYNADGTLASHTDFNGATRTFEYDANQRLTRRAYPDGSEVSFTYTLTGQRATVTDARGTTSYTYDDRDRLVEKTDPTGYKLGYGYDLQGNRIRLTAIVGPDSDTTSYTYDNLNRVETVTGSQGGVTALGYDDNGNPQTLAHPNGVTTTYTYDSLNRLTFLETVNSVGAVQSYAYTLGDAGNRTRIDEHDGTSRHYIYDDLYRLTQDRVTDPADALVYQRDFTYDPVGNRLEQVVDEGGGASTIASAYDDRDRLLTAEATSYGWDTNGNLTSQDGTSYEWDFENRLTSVALADGTLVETTYDADGNRVRTLVTPSGGGAARVVDYLVDTTGFLSHVVADVVGGSVQTLYTRADDQLIGLYRPASGSSRYYHADGLGSVRALSDEPGAVADRYRYTAFGVLLEHVGSDLNTYRFAGERLDPESELYYNRARWLGPGSGRFVSVDTFEGVVEIPSSLNKFVYGADDPVNNLDPTGKFTGSASEIAVVGAAEISLAPTVLLAIYPVVQICSAQEAAAAASRRAISPTLSPSMLPDPCELGKKNQMRVQLQTGKTTSEGPAPLIAPSSIGVSALQVRTALAELYVLIETYAPWFPSKLRPELKSAIIRMSQFLGLAVGSGGVIQGGNVHRETFVDATKRTAYRLDLENLRGHNLKI